MKKYLVLSILFVFVFGFGYSIGNIAYSDGTGLKIAYVNTSKLLLSSKAIKTAQQTREKQTKEMLSWYDSASSEIKKQTNKQDKEKLIKKYETQLTTKKKTIKDAYAKKITEADSQMSNVINQKAQELGYNLVLRSDCVLFGGDDITDKVLPLVK